MPPSTAFGRTVRSEFDSPIADDDVEQLRLAVRDVEVTTVSGAGHLIARDAPDQLGTIIAETARQWTGLPQ